LCYQESRLAVYEKTRQTIRLLADELEIGPRSVFEADVISGSVSTFVPTADNMQLLQQCVREVCE